MRRVGVLLNLAANDPMGQARVAAFARGLQATGWSDGRNVRIDTRWAAADPGNYRKYAMELMALGPDVILASTTAAVAQLQQASRTVAIVFVSTIDPVGSGLITSMARPGGNVTGFVIFEYALAAKWLELLKEIAPGVKRAAVLRDAAVASGIGQFAAIQAAGSVGMELSAIDLRDVGEIERAIADFAQHPNGGLIVTASQFGTNHPAAARRVGGSAQAARGLPLPLFCQCGRPDLLRAQSAGRISPRGRLCRPHPQGREACRPSGASADQVRACDQSQDREGARPRSAARRCSPAPTR